jgi:hypothetical protein
VLCYGRREERPKGQERCLKSATAILNIHDIPTGSWVFTLDHGREDGLGLQLYFVVISKLVIKLVSYMLSWKHIVFHVDD